MIALRLPEYVLDDLEDLDDWDSIRRGILEYTQTVLAHPSPLRIPSPRAAARAPPPPSAPRPASAVPSRGPRRPPARWRTS